MRTCKECRYWLPKNAARTGGHCKRYPPDVVVVEDDDGDLCQTRDMFPVTSSEEWCGEFQGRN